MGASNPNGEMQFWANGQPFPGILKINGGEMEVSFYGQPYPAIFGIIVTGPANVKTWDGVALSSVKTIIGVPVANIKSINGVV